MTAPKMPLPPTMAPLAQQTRPKVRFAPVAKSEGQRIVLYGPGGIGKTTLVAKLAGNSAFVDLDESLGSLRNLEVKPQIVSGISTWQDMRDALQSDGWDDIKNVVIDTGTKAEELAIKHVISTIKGEKNQVIRSVEDYGWGKGYQFVYETFLTLLSDLDTHVRAGRNVVIICHDCTQPVPNPGGDDWLQYQPRLQHPNSGKSSIRLRVREWADHVLFLGYDIAVDKNGKGTGSGTRTLYTNEFPHCMAKCRSMRGALIVDDNNNIWESIL